MNEYMREELDCMEEETFFADNLEKSIDLGFNPTDVIAGDTEALAEFIRLRKAAKMTY